MPDKFYDVIVVGRSIGALVTAALLARRDFTVLVVGHGHRRVEYALDDLVLRRRAFTMLAATSPVWRRITAELAQTQTWQRKIVPLSPMLQVIAGASRFDVPPDAELFVREVEREFGDVRRLITDLYANFARIAGAADAAFERDAIWPPGSFFERRRTGRVASTLPYAQAEPHADLLAEFPQRHRYRHVVTESVRFGVDLAGRPPAFAVARIHAAWTRGLFALERSEAELDELLLERIVANGGEVLAEERVAGIEVRAGKVAGVLIDGDTRPMGAGWLVTDRSGEEVAALAGGKGISKKAQREWPRIVPTAGRFVVSLVVREEGVPRPLGREALVLGPEDPTAPAVHLQRGMSREGRTELTAEVLRSDRDPLALTALRGWVLRRLATVLPFLERHLLVVDSPHDGLPVWRYEPTGGRPSPPTLVARSQLRGGSLRAESMVRQLEVDPPGYLGVGGEPLRGPIARTLLVGPSVLPGLGQEGQLLAATSAARLITRSDKRKARMRREMWTKLEIS